MYENIFKYQECDMEIFKIKKRMQTTEYKKIISTMVQKNKDIQRDKDVMEKEANLLLNQINEVKNSINNEKNEMESLESQFNENKITKEIFVSKEMEVSTRLNNLLKKLVKLQKDVEIVNKKFDELKKNAKIIKINYKNAKEAQENFEKNELHAIQKLENDKKELSKNIDSAIMNEYEKYKKDNIMPVYVKLYNNECCGGCMQKLSTSQLSKDDKRIDCEMCRRIIIKE